MSCSAAPRSSASRLVAYAEGRLAAGQLADADACLIKAIAMQPSLSHAHYLRGGALVLSGNSFSAVPHFQRAVLHDPRHADAHFELGNALYGQQELDSAAHAYGAALDVQPTRALCYANLGNLYREQSAPERAERAYRMALRLLPVGPDSCPAHNGLGNALEADGRASEAEAVAKRALELAAECHYAAHNLARLLRHRGEHAAAVRHARAARRAAPTQLEYSVGLAAALHSAGTEGAPGALAEAVGVYGAALRVAPTDHRLQVDMGGALTQLGRHAEATQAYASALPLQLAHAARELGGGGAAGTAVGASDVTGGTGGGTGGSTGGGRSRRVVFYCRLRAHAGAESAAEDSWGPSSLGRGVGGSEEAVIFISRELARRGWAVEVYANPPASDLAASDHGVVWRPWHALRADDAADVLVAWRNVEAALLLPRAARRYVWLQDIVDAPEAYLYPGLLSRLSGVLVLSAFHRRGLPRAAQRHAVLTSNGIDAAHLVRGSNAPHRMMYAAWPTAGLQPLLERWPRLRRRLGDALGAAAGRPRKEPTEEPILAVYYGFPRWLEQMHGAEAWYPQWRQHMEELLRQPGVEYHGMVNHTTIAAAYATSGFYLFPSDKPETSGVNLMKAQATPTPAGRHSDPCIPPSQQLPICTGLALIDPVIWCRRRWEQYL